MGPFRRGDLPLGDDRADPALSVQEDPPDIGPEFAEEIPARVEAKGDGAAAEGVGGRAKMFWIPGVRDKLTTHNPRDLCDTNPSPALIRPHYEGGGNRVPDSRKDAPAFGGKVARVFAQGGTDPKLDEIHRGILADS